MKRIFGWILTLAGAPLAVVFGLFTLFYFGRGPYGIIIAIYFTGPLFLIGLALAALGSFLRNHTTRTASSPSFRNGALL